MDAPFLLLSILTGSITYFLKGYNKKLPPEIRGQRLPGIPGMALGKGFT
jgi:hypothetical protein